MKLLSSGNKRGLKIFNLLHPVGFLARGRSRGFLLMDQFFISDKSAPRASSKDIINPPRRVHDRKSDRADQTTHKFQPGYYYSGGGIG
jgi:hypothetical protein